jgi:hypothetical protein
MRYEVGFLDLGDWTHFAVVVGGDSHMLIINTRNVRTDAEDAKRVRTVVADMVRLARTSAMVS